jgi:uncharacterized protein (TIGR03118 family)
MKQVFQKVIKLSFTSAIIISWLLLIIISSCQKETRQTEQEQSIAKPPKLAKDFTQVNLVDNNGEYGAAVTDPNLLNAWGIAFSSGGTAWVSAEAKGVSVVYNREGVIQGISPVAIPSPTATTGGHPTGQVFNPTTDFKLPNGNKAAFIFAGDDGVISGWNGGSAAIRMINDAPDAAYFGITIGSDGGNNFLYAANFAEKKIDVYDKNWAEVTTKPFTDPDLPSDYSPFNIQNVGGKLYVMYAKVGPDGDEIHHEGFGIVDIYNPNGSLVKRFVSNGQLNSPWGVAWAPASFFGSDIDAEPAILIGNFGDGRINAYTLDGDYLGQLRAHGNPIVIEGLWAITFPPSTSTIDPNRLYFSAGPDDEEDGLFGYITK